jgi:hypothetical protein
MNSTPAARRPAALDLAIVLGAIVVAWQFSKWVLYPALSIPDYAPLILRPITGGYLTDRIATLLGGKAAAIGFAIVAQALLFGSMHLSALHATTFALVHGVFYALAGRNLWPLIVVHGLWNSVGMWGVYNA